MIIDSNRLKYIITDNALDETVSLTWVFKMIEKAEKEILDYLDKE